MNNVVTKLEIAGVRVTSKTSWVFLRLTNGQGLTGLGEATLNGQDLTVAAAARAHGHLVLGATADDAESLFERLPFTTLEEAAFASAAMQAIWDLGARARNASLADALGGAIRDSVPTYANINRRTRERSPAGFARSASDAIASGFTAIKIAPFDEVAPDMDETDIAPALEAGLQRIAATREQIGPKVRLMVDCHWRFNEATARRAVDAAAEFDLHWLECPIAETEDNLAALRRLRTRANGAGMRLAGCEKAIRLAGFEPFLKAGAYDAMMPDIKYAGGPMEMLRIAEAFRGNGVEFSPHNPTGPICHAASVQLCAAVEHLDLLELQFDETPLFDRLVRNQSPTISQGSARLPTQHAGIGVSLDDDVIRTLEATVHWEDQVAGQ